MLVLAAHVVYAQSNLMVTTVATFYRTNGAYPREGLLSGADGMLYGVTSDGGASGIGTIYKTTLDGSLTTLVSFNATNGANPSTKIIQTSDGYFYGVTAYGGANASGGYTGNGTIFGMNSNGDLTSLFSFNGTNGAYPQCLVAAQDGALYGVTFAGGTFTNVLEFGMIGYGTAFKITTNGVFTALFSFAGTNGRRARSLIQASDGNFYGTTMKGGLYDLGTVFRMTPEGAVTTLISFDGTNGATPWRLIEASDRFLYGVTDEGGSNLAGNQWGTTGYGTIFKIATNGDFTSLASFNNGDGAFPRTELIEVTNGVFLGVAYQGGSDNYGTIFRYSTNGTLTSFFSFDLDHGGKTGMPVSGFVKGIDGNYYGISQLQYGSLEGGIYCLRPLEVPTVSPAFENNQLSLSWQGYGGCNYEVRYRTDLSGGVWNYISTITPTNNRVVSYPAPVTSDSQRFYKVLLRLPGP